MKTITIRASRQYNVLIGESLLNSAGTYIKEAFRNGDMPKKLAIITDHVVDQLYGQPDQPLTTSLREAGFTVHKFVFQSGESAKNLHTINDILEFLASEEVALTRSDALLALGGGVTGDITGFSAATYLRGIPFVQIPTTLLAAVDSSVGGKTGVNLKAGKNLAGAFWQPSLVLFDSDTVRTLPKTLVLDGLAEAIKCGIIAEKDFVKYIEQKSSLIAACNYCSSQESVHIMEDIVIEAVSIKRAVVEEDERDNGIRQILNLGHTVGHAIEKCSNYEISHGKAVAMGMMVIARASLADGITKDDFIQPLQESMETLGFDLHCPYTATELAHAALSDKKRRGDEITFVVPLHLGQCTLKKMKIEQVEAFIQLGLD